MKQKTGWIGVAFALCLLPGCAPMSESVEDAAVGRNGGFERTESGLPVNWMAYSPKTVPEGRFELSLDGTEFKEGTQSLKFAVEECSDEGGWYSPGIAQEFPAEPGLYRIRFWIKNDGCDYRVTAGGVSAKTGEIEVVDSAAGSGAGWRQVVRTITIPPRYPSLRFELSIRSPGNLWIDGVTIERVADS